MGHSWMICWCAGSASSATWSPSSASRDMKQQQTRAGGQGVAGKAKAAIVRMRRAGIFFGTSLTVTRLNIDAVLDEQYLCGLIDLGCRLFFFVEYVPVREGTESLVLDSAQRARLVAVVASLQKRLRGLFIVFPGDEEVFGGCLAAGRGFIHISPSGRVEPCPFAPYSDANVRDVPLRDALASPLLVTIRTNHDRLTEKPAEGAPYGHSASGCSRCCLVRRRKTPPIGKQPHEADRHSLRTCLECRGEGTTRQGDDVRSHRAGAGESRGGADGGLGDAGSARRIRAAVPPRRQRDG